MSPNRLLIATIIGVMAAFGRIAPSFSADVHEIDQIIDLNALVAEDVHRFVPNYLWIEPGDTLRFLNSLGNHTVTSITNIWPEGAETVNIEHQAVAEVVLDRPGVYGFRCKVHGRHGMYALIVVGSPDANLDRIKLDHISRRGRKVFEGLLKRLNDDITRRAK